MKSNQFLLIIIPLIGFLFYSCNSGHNQNDSVAPAQQNLRVMEDSIRNARRMEFVEDSINFTKIRGFSTTLLSGEHTFGGRTSIVYESIFQILKEVEDNSKNQMWTPQEKERKIKAYLNEYRGGRITLKIERKDIDQANTEWFSIIIKDLNEQEKYRFKLKNDIPETPISDDYWWNLSIVGLHDRIELPFYVYIVDEVSNTNFKFEVNERR